MPHKHKRRRIDDGTSFDLPPSKTAEPLPTFRQRAYKNENGAGTSKRSNRQEQNGHATTWGNGKGKKDDTPRAFLQLLNFRKNGQRVSSGLDDGRPINRASGTSTNTKANKPEDGQKRRSTNITAVTVPAPAMTAQVRESTPPRLEIQPGERLADFAARVDQSMPFSTMQKTHNQTSRQSRSNLQALGIKSTERKTRHNRRLENMQKQWREEEKRRKEILEEEMEEREEEFEEHDRLWTEVNRSRSSSKNSAGKKAKGQKRKRGKNAHKQGAKGSHHGDENDEADGDNDDDPWAQLEQKRGAATRQKNLQDVVQAPPQLKGIVVSDSTTTNSNNKSRLIRKNNTNYAAGSNATDPTITTTTTTTTTTGTGPDVVLVDVKNTPSTLGSLRRREEVAGMRREFIERYREKMMGQRV